MHTLHSSVAASRTLGLSSKRVKGLSPARPCPVKASGGAQLQLGDSSVAHMLQQHRLLMKSGFTHDQASLVLQFAQQRRTASSLMEDGPNAHAPGDSESVAAPSISTATADSAAAAIHASTPSTTSSQQALPSAVVKALEDRISFLELELLKQSLASHADAGLPPTSNASTNSYNPVRGSGSLAGTARALNPAAAGSSSVGAAAAATAHHWTADSLLLRQGAAASSAASLGRPSGAATIGSELATAAELGQLDPEVLAIAEVLAVRQGLGGLQDSYIGGGSNNPLTQQNQQLLPQYQQSSSIWGRTAHHSMPLQARAWGDYEAGPGEPLLAPGIAEDEVPYKPTGWAVAGTVAVVYLGVLATFLAMCIGDVPYC